MAHTISFGHDAGSLSSAGPGAGGPANGGPIAFVPAAAAALVVAGVVANLLPQSDRAVYAQREADIRQGFQNALGALPGLSEGAMRSTQRAFDGLLAHLKHIRFSGGGDVARAFMAAVQGFQAQLPHLLQGRAAQAPAGRQRKSPPAGAAALTPLRTAPRGHPPSARPQLAADESAQLKRVRRRAGALRSQAQAGKPLTEAQLGEGGPRQALADLSKDISALLGLKSPVLAAYRDELRGTQQAAAGHVAGLYRLSLHKAIAGEQTYSNAALEALLGQATAVMTAPGDAPLLQTLLERLRQGAQAQPSHVPRPPAERRHTPSETASNQDGIAAAPHTQPPGVPQIRQTVPLLTHDENEAWQRYVERYPDIADLIRTAAAGATDAAVAEAIRMLLQGFAVGQDVVAALRNGGATSGRLPPGGGTRPAALAGEEPEPDPSFPAVALQAPVIGHTSQGRRTRPLGAAVAPTGPLTVRPLQPFEVNPPGVPPRPDAAPALNETRRGVHFSLSLPGSYELFVRAWTQHGNPLPALLWSELVNTFDRRGPMEAIADTLSKRLPPEISWRVSLFPPPPIGLSNLGLERLSSLVIEIEPAVASGAVKYDPRKKTYSLNLIETPAGRSLAAPLAVQLVEARGVAPFDIPGLPSLPLHPSWKREVLKVWNVTLDGPIDAQLAAAITRAINQGPLCKELWYQPGQIKARAKWRVRFALPGSVAREGTHRLPKDWTNLASRLLSPERRVTPDQVFKSDWFGIKLRAGLAAALQGYRQNITSSPDYAAKQPNLWRPAPQGPRAIQPRPLAELAFVPAAGPGEGGRIVLHAPSGADDVTPLGRERLDPKAVTQLVLPDAGSRRVAISGAVLNALNGHAVEASDLPAITQFLRSLDVASIGLGRSGRGVLSWNAGLVYEVMSAFERGQPFPPETINSMYTAIEKFIEALPSASGTLNLPGP